MVLKVAEKRVFDTFKVVGTERKTHRNYGIAFALLRLLTSTCASVVVQERHSRDTKRS